jgi:hypothetical protein
MTATTSRLARPLKPRRILDSKTEPINGHKGVPLGDGSQLLSMRMAICQALHEEMTRDGTIVGTLAYIANSLAQFGQHGLAADFQALPVELNP